MIKLFLLKRYFYIFGYDVNCIVVAIKSFSFSSFSHLYLSFLFLFHSLSISISLSLSVSHCFSVSLYLLFSLSISMFLSFYHRNLLLFIRPRNSLKSLMLLSALFLILLILSTKRYIVKRYNCLLSSSSHLLLGSVTYAINGSL